MDYIFRIIWMKKYLVVDSNALIHRAYHAYPPTLTLRDATPINAVLGFTTLLVTAIEKVHPEFVICTFDNAKPTFRHEQFVDYKAHRQAVHEDLIVQFPLTQEIVKAFDIPIYTIDGYEADDLIGTICEKLKKENKVVIVTGDSDQYQLSDKNVDIFMAARSFKDSKIMNFEDVEKKLGFLPKFLIDYKGIKGDTSDNIPGIKGIGDKVATDLIRLYGDIDSIYRNIDQIKSKSVREKLVNGYDMAILSKKLATIDTNAPVGELDYHELLFGDFEMDKVNEVFTKFEFRSLRDRVAKLKLKYNNDLIGGESISLSENTLNKGRKKLSLKAVKEEIETPIEIDGVMVGWDIKDYIKSRHTAEFINTSFFDLSISEFVLSMGQKNSKPDVNEYEKLYRSHKEMLENHPKLKSLIYDLEFPLIKILYEMEMNGINVDINSLDNTAKILDENITEVTKKIYTFVGHEFNISSPKQVGEVLANELNIPLKKNKLGNFQTGESELAKFNSAFEVIGDILSYREYTKLKTTYVEGLKKCIREDGKIHTTYHQTIASTGRLSSKDPNLQNIPKGTEIADSIKAAFRSTEGYKLVSFDYSQQELRLLAYLSGEENMLSAYREGMDIHKQTASKIFSVPYSEVTKEQRSIAKTVNFGLVYGQGAFGLSEQLGKPVKECQGFIDKFFESFPKLRIYFDNLLIEGQKVGYIETILGRRRSTAGLKSPIPMMRNAAKRELINFPIQGSAADMTKLAMVNISKANLTNTSDCRLLLQVHDELLFEILENEQMDSKIKKIEKIMTEVLDICIPIEVDYKINDRWGK